MKRLLSLFLSLFAFYALAEMKTVTLCFEDEYWVPPFYQSGSLPKHIQVCLLPMMLQFLPPEDVSALEQFVGSTHYFRTTRRFWQYYGKRNPSSYKTHATQEEVWTLLQEVAAKKKVSLELEPLSSDVFKYTWLKNKNVLEAKITNPYEDCIVELSGTLMSYPLPIKRLAPKESFVLKWNLAKKYQANREKPAEPVPFQYKGAVFINGKPQVYELSIPEIDCRGQQFVCVENEPEAVLQFCAPCADYAQHHHLSEDEMTISFSRTRIMINGKASTEGALCVNMVLNVAADRMRVKSSEQTPPQIQRNGVEAGLLKIRPTILGGRSRNISMSLTEKIMVVAEDRLTMNACLILPNGNHLKVSCEGNVK